MSERIYAFFLRLFPRHFKQSYGSEALQLFRDRLRDEEGFVPRLRLWFDLLADLAISLPREYRKVPVELEAAPVVQHSQKMLSFRVLQGEPPRPEAIFAASVLSLAALGVFAIAIGHAGDYRPFRAFVAPVRPTPHLRPAAPSRASTSSNSDGDEEAIGPSSHTADAPPLRPKALGRARARDASKPLTAVAAGSAQAAAFPLQPKAVEDAKAGDARKPLLISASGPEIDAEEKQRVLEAATANLRQHYFDRDVAQKVVDELTARAKSGEYDKVQTGAGFAALLTGQIRDVSQDMHLEMVYSRSALPPQPSMTMSAEGLARYRTAMEQSNCTIEKVETLPHNIGYLKINSFPEASICGARIQAAKTSLNRSDGVIFDLRDNGGGAGNMVSMLAAYLFQHPQYLYSPREVPSEQSRTQSPVKGNRLADKPVYLLTSGTTVSAAEDFVYNLKMLHRATLVGETTQGSAHAGVFHRIDDHFGMGIPEVKVVNPYGKSDWEGVGVEPDVKVKAADALTTAEQLASGRLRKK